MTHSELVMIAYKWVLKNGSCGFAFRELVTLCDEIPDVIGFGSWGHSILIECKISRADFLGDKKKKFRIDGTLGMGRHRAYCCPEGLIQPDEIPPSWGLLWVKNNNTRIKVPMYRGNIGLRETVHVKNMQAEMNMMYSALRRLHLRGRMEEIYDNPNIKP